MFTITDDHRNRLVLRLYNDAAAHLPDHRLHVLDCYDWTDVCKKINVTQFPTIRIYKKGSFLPYKGPLSKDSFIKMAHL